MSALASLEKFGEEYLVFLNWKSYKHSLQNEWSLVVFMRETPSRFKLGYWKIFLPHPKDFSWLMSSAETANDADDS